MKATQSWCLSFVYESQLKGSPYRWNSFKDSIEPSVKIICNRRGGDHEPYRRGSGGEELTLTT